MRWKRRIALWFASAVVIVLATACARAESPPQEEVMDITTVESQLAAIDGVSDAKLLNRNDGAPGRIALTVQLTLGDDEISLDSVITHAVRTVAANPGDYVSYRFTVLLSTSEGVGRLSLKSKRDEIAISTGRYLGASLVFLPDELAEAAAQ